MPCDQNFIDFHHTFADFVLFLIQPIACLTKDKNLNIFSSQSTFKYFSIDHLSIRNVTSRSQLCWKASDRTQNLDDVSYWELFLEIRVWLVKTNIYETCGWFFIFYGSLGESTKKARNILHELLKINSNGEGGVKIQNIFNSISKPKFVFLYPHC